MLAMHTMWVLNGLTDKALSTTMARGIKTLRAFYRSTHLIILLNAYRTLSNFSRHLGGLVGLEGLGAYVVRTMIEFVGTIIVNFVLNIESFVKKYLYYGGCKG
jgi:hypothetical protein